MSSVRETRAVAADKYAWVVIPLRVCGKFCVYISLHKRLTI